MIVRLLKPWKFRKVGSILNDMPDGMANLLIQRRMAEPLPGPVKSEPLKTERPKRVAR